MRHVDPRQVGRAAERERIRARIEARIERFIAKLDQLDGDPDLEPDLGDHHPHALMDGEADCWGGATTGSADDEPSLGARPLMNQERGWADRTCYGMHDLEFGGDVADPEAEPSLGSIGNTFHTYSDQTQWAIGARDDREEENEHGTDLDAGELDESDKEPADGWADNLDQTNLGDAAEREEDDGRGYTEDVLRGFRTPDVHEAAMTATRQLNAVRYRTTGSNVRHIFGIPVVGRVRC